MGGPLRGVQPSVLDDIKGLQAKIADNLARAVKDNDFIYLHPVPTESNLPPIVPANLAKSTIPPEIADPIAHLTDKALGKPLFASLVPYSVHVAISLYDDRKENLLREEIIASCDELDALSASTLQALNLPGSLQAMEQPVGLPPSLLNSAEQIRQESGPTKIERLLKHVQDSSDIAQGLLLEAYQLLANEEQDDLFVRGQMEEGRWTRPASAIVNGKLVGKAEKFKQTLEAAASSDVVVRQKWLEWKEAVVMLSRSEEELEKSIPSLAVPKLAYDRALSNSEAAQLAISRELRQQLEVLDDLQSARRPIVNDARRLTEADDIRSAVIREAGQLSSKSLHDNSETGLRKLTIETADFEPLFGRELKKYQIFRDAIRGNAAKQKELLHRISATNERLLSSRKSDENIKAREVALQLLDLAYHKYREIEVNLKEGTTFYQNFAKDTCKQILSALRDEVREWVRIRTLESRDLQDQLAEQLGGMKLGGARSPSHSSITSNGFKNVQTPGQWDPSKPIRFG